MCAIRVFFFFFQAEDGIRDGHVTGVQTCALPISSTCVAWATTESDREPSSGDGCRPRPQLLLPQQGAPSFRDGRATGDPGGRRGGDPAEGPSGPAVRR